MKILRRIDVSTNYKCVMKCVDKKKLQKRGLQFIKQLKERDARESRLRPSVVRRPSQMFSYETLIITFTAIVCFSLYTIYINSALHKLKNMFLKHQLSAY